MKSHIIVMQDLLIKILKNQYQRNLQKQQLFTSISQHAPINDFVSFYAILNLMLVAITKNKVDDSYLHQVIPMIIKIVIRNNKNRLCQFDHNGKIIDSPIAQLAADDQDFYLDHSVCFLLQKKILDNTKLCAFIQKNITKPKYINSISDQLGEIFYSTLKNYLDCNPPINDSEQNCSSTSSFTPN